MTHLQDTSASPPAQASQPSPSPTNSDPSPSHRSLLWFVQRYPLIFWSVLFSSLMFLMALATVLLVNPPKFTPENPQPLVKTRPSEAVTPPAQQPLPSHWTLGAITLSCATVSLLITMGLGGSTKPPRRLIKQSKPAPHSEPHQKSKPTLLSAILSPQSPQPELPPPTPANGKPPQLEGAMPPTKPAAEQPSGNSTPRSTSLPPTSANP